MHHFAIHFGADERYSDVICKFYSHLEVQEIQKMIYKASILSLSLHGDKNKYTAININSEQLLSLPNLKKQRRVDVCNYQHLPRHLNYEIIFNINSCPLYIDQIMTLNDE